MRRAALLILTIAMLSQPAWAFEELDVKAAGYGSRNKSEVVKKERSVVGVPNTKEEEVPVSKQPKGFMYSTRKAPVAAPASSSGGTSSSTMTTTRFGRNYRSWYGYDRSFHGRLGVAVNQIDINSRIGGFYDFNEFLSSGVDVNYRAEKQDLFYRSVVAGEGYGRAQLPNYTMFTPQMQAGVGYESWRITEAGSAFERGGTWYLVAGLGLDISMTRNFGLLLQKVFTRYDRAPLMLEGATIAKRQSTQDRIEVIFHYVI